MRKWLILLSALSATSATSAPAWTWVDANGTVHFSDRPVAGARQIDITGAQGFGTQTAIGRSLPPTTAPPEATPALYQSVEIVSPAEQETLRDIGGNLSVRVRFQPALRSGHRFDLALDGERRNLNSTTPLVTLPNVFRGTHTLQLVVLDADGVELMRSGSRNFTVLQTSILNPNNPLNRAPPQARPRSDAN